MSMYIHSVQFGAGKGPTDTRLIPDSRAPEGTARDHRGLGWVICIANGSAEGQTGTGGDAAGKAVNRKVVGSSPSSGASFEFKFCDLAPSSGLSSWPLIPDSQSSGRALNHLRRRAGPVGIAVEDTPGAVNGAAAATAAPVATRGPAWGET